MISAIEALERLREGNRRFVSGVSSRRAATFAERRAKLAVGQEPFAIVLGCSDSRVPPEIIFDQGLGDLFVVRVAGNVATPSQVGSIEFAADGFGTRLIVVLGHTNCGAVLGTLDELEDPRDAPSADLAAIIDRIRATVEPLLEDRGSTSQDELISKAVRSNVEVSAHHLRHASAAFERLILTEGLLVVGAEYSLETGVVDFFDGLPQSP